MWFEGFPDGVRGLLYSYVRHPCAEMIQERPLYLTYVYKRELPECVDLCPSRLGTSSYGEGAIVRAGLSWGEKIRLKYRPDLIHRSRSISFT